MTESILADSAPAFEVTKHKPKPMPKKAKTEEPETNRARKLPLRTPYGFDRRKLHFEGGDPNMHYRWGLIDDPERPGRMAECEEFGFTMVKKGEVKFRGQDPHSSYTSTPAGKGGGKMILMKMPMEHKEYHDRQRERYNNELLFNRSKNALEPERLTITTDSREGV